jgi:hypothetical protein
LVVWIIFFTSGSTRLGSECFPTDFVIWRGLRNIVTYLKLRRDAEINSNCFYWADWIAKQYTSKLGWHYLHHYNPESVCSLGNDSASGWNVLHCRGAR